MEQNKALKDFDNFRRGRLDKIGSETWETVAASLAGAAQNQSGLNLYSNNSIRVDFVYKVSGGKLEEYGIQVHVK